MQKLILRLIINAVALWVAITFVPGIKPVEGGLSWLGILGLALIFGLVNALFRPLLKFLTCPLIVLTLGLFTLLINTLMFWLSGLIGTWLGFGFTVDGFWAAFFGALVTTIVSVILTLLVKDELKEKKKK